LEVCSSTFIFFESANSIGMESESAVMVNQGQDVVEIIRENEM
jgi:hypothetical protein